jgi:MFS family permease
MLRNVNLVVAARFVSRAGGEAAFFVGIWGKAAYEFSANPRQLAAVMAALGVSVLMGSAISGVLVDRFGPRKVLMLGEVLFVPATLAVLLAQDITQLVLFAALLGLFEAPVLTAIGSFAPYLTDDPQELDRINGRIEAAGMAAFVAGPALGALIVRYTTVDWVFVADALTSVVAVGLVSFVAIRRVRRAARSSAWRQLREGFSYSYRIRRLRFYLLLGTALWFTFGSFGALEPLYFRDVLGVSIEALGWVNTVFGGGLVVGSLLLARLPGAVKSARGAVALAGLNAIGILLYVGTDRLQVVVAGAVVWGLLIGALVPLLRTLIHLESPEPLIGRISGTVQVHSTAGELLPLALAPVLAAAWGVQPVLVGAGAFLGLVALLSYREAVALDQSGPRPPPAAEPLRVGDEPISPTP